MKSNKVKYCVGCSVIRSQANTDVMSSGLYRGRCKECFKIWSKEYEKTEKGYLVRTYRNMLSRVKGVQKEKAHLYEGLEILDKKDFYDFSKKDSTFINLLSAYKCSGYDMKLAPSIDRINSYKGYVIGNIRWITHSENSAIGSVSEKRYPHE